MESKLKCECHNWFTLRASETILTDHNENCPFRPDPLKCAFDLIRALTHGIEAWGNEEDGVYPGVWESYKKAKAVLGELHQVKENES